MQVKQSNTTRPGGESTALTKALYTVRDWMNGLALSARCCL
jgi:hypothetical protein